MIKILFFGDVVGKPGREGLFKALPALKKEHQPSLIIINAENSANGRGVTFPIYQNYLNAGIHCLSSGNHIFDNQAIFNFLNEAEQLIIPANYSELTPGNRIFYYNQNKVKIAVVCLLGQTFMPPIDSPFKSMEKLLNDELKNQDVIIVDFHAEATSEKIAFAKHFKNKVSLIVGTHTHVQTNDAQIIENTGFICDVGMVGAENSILGMGETEVIDKFLTQMPNRFSPPETYNNLILNYLTAEISDDGKCQKIEALKKIIAKN